MYTMPMKERELKVTAASVGVVVENDRYPGKILVVEETAVSPKSGMRKTALSIPGGYIRRNESAGETAERVVKEITGYQNIRIYKGMKVYQTERILTLVFVALASGDMPSYNSSDTTRICWKTPTAIFNGEYILRDEILRNIAIDYAYKQFVDLSQYYMDLRRDGR